MIAIRTSPARGLLAAWLWIGLAGCGTAAQSPGAGSQFAASADDPVATVDGVPVTRAALEDAVAPEIAKLTQKAYDLRKAQLDDLIGQRLLEAEAKRRGTTVDGLIASEITAKIAPVTDEDIEAFVAANRQRLGADPSRLTSQIRGYLEEQRKNDVRSAFIDGLRAKAKIAIHLDAPRHQIDLTGAPVRGPEDAPVTVVEFSDFHCPFCRRVQPTLRELLRKYPTQVRIVYKHFPLDNLHPGARRAADASWCAQQQDRFWQFHDLVYDSPPEASTGMPMLTELAAKAGLDVPAFAQCLSSGKAEKVVEEQFEEGNRNGVDGTPGFFINGRLVSGAVPLSTLSEIVDEELAQAKSR